MSDPDYRGAFLAVAKLCDREVALDFCLVHAGLRPGFFDQPGDRIDPWVKKTEKALKLAATYGVRLKASYSVDRRFPGALIYSRGSPDVNRMSHYELGLALGYPEEVCGKLGTLRNQVYGIHFWFGRTDGLYFVAWELTNTLFRYLMRNVADMKDFIERSRIPLKGAVVTINRFDRTFKSKKVSDFKYRRTLTHRIVSRGKLTEITKVAKIAV